MQRFKDITHVSLLKILRKEVTLSFDALNKTDGNKIKHFLDFPGKSVQNVSKLF